ncbi:MAG: DUF6449 domain-containing protein [Syntrophomonadaceae bacterium]
MKSKISFINTGILRNDFKSMGWLGVAYLLGLLLSVPLQILMIYSRQETRIINEINNPYLHIFQFETGLVILLLLTVPVLAGLLLFRYLHSSPAVDMIHTLPVKRETLYNSHLTAGIIFLWVPLIITALVSWLTLNSLGISYVSGGAVWNWLWSSAVFSLLLFMTCVAVGMFCGMYTVQAAITYIILFLPTGFSMMLLHNISMYLYGFANGYYSSSINNLSPITRFTELSHRPFTTAEVSIYLLSCVVLYLVGRYLYRHRPLEAAGNAITFTALRPVFKYGVTFCTMLMMGSYFHSMQQTMAWTYFGYVLGALLGYWLSEILLNYSFHVFRWKAARGCLGFALVMIILVAGLNNDLLGFEQKMPEFSQVESVYWNQSFTFLSDRYRVEASLAEFGDNSYHRIVTREYLTPSNMNNIYRLQQAIIANRETEKNRANVRRGNDNYQQMCFRYKLKDGRFFYRQYYVNMDSYYKQLKPIYESLEHKRMVNDILHISPRQVDVLEISANHVARSVKITDPALIQQAIAFLQADVRSESYEDMTSNKPGWADISLLLNNDKRLHLEWRKSYTGLGSWLKEIGEYQNARIIAENDIDYVIIAKSSYDSDRPREKFMTQDVEQYLADMQKNGVYLKITDSQQIEECLNNYTYQGADYDVLFVLKNGNNFTGGLDTSNLPDAAKDYFNLK